MPQLPSTDFGLWLKAQSAREDRIGDLGRWYVADLKQHAVPVQPYPMLKHLRAVHRAGVEQLTVLYEAWQEWHPRRLLHPPAEQARRALLVCTNPECGEFADGLEGFCIPHSRVQPRF